MSVSGIKAGRAFVHIEALDKTGAVLKSVEGRLKKFAGWANDIGDKLMKVGMAMLAPAALSLPVYVRFDDAMRRVQARSQATGDEFRMLTDQAKELGRTTSFTAQQVAALQEVLAQKGFKPDAIRAMTASILDFSRAAGTGSDEDTTLAADLIGGVLRNFQMDADQTARVADVLTRAINSSNLSLQKFADAFPYVGPIAKSVGAEFEEVVALLGQLGNANIEASMSGTGLRQLIIGISDQTKMAAFNDFLLKFGRTTVQVADSAGNLRPISDVIADIGRAMEGIGNEEAIFAFQNLFGDRALASASALARARDEFDGFHQSLLQAGGTAARTAKEMDAGAGGSWRMLTSALEGIQIAIGEALEGPLSKLMDDFTAWSLKVVGWIAQNEEFVVSITKTGAQLLAVGAALKLVGFAASGLSSVTAFFAFIVANPIAATIAAIAASIGLLVYATMRMAEINQGTGAAWAERIEFTKQANAADQAMMDRLAELADVQSLTNEQQQEANDLIAKLTEKYGDLGLSVDAATGKLLGMEEAQKRVTEAQKKFRTQDVENAIRELKRQEGDAVRRASGDWDTWGEFSNDWLNPFSDPRQQAMQDLERIAEQLKAREAELAAIEAGSREALGIGEQPVPDAPPPAAGPPVAPGRTPWDKMFEDLEAIGRGLELEYGRKFEETRREAREATQQKIDDILEAQKHGYDSRPGYTDAVEANTMEAARQAIENQATARAMDKMAEELEKHRRLLEKIESNTADATVLMEATKR